MNKRGDTTVWHEIVKAIPAMMLVLILFAAGVKIYNITHPEQYSTEKKDLLRLVAEIKDLKEPQGDMIDTVSIPLFSRGYTIEGAVTTEQKEKEAYLGCNLDYCVCFKKDSKLVMCETFNLREAFDPAKRCKKNNENYKGVGINNKDNPTTNNPLTVGRTGTCNITISGSAAPLLRSEDANQVSDKSRGSNAAVTSDSQNSELTQVNNNLEYDAWDFSDISPNSIAEVSTPSQVDSTYKKISTQITVPGVKVDLSYFGQVPARIRENGVVTKIVLHHTGGGSVYSAVSTWSSSEGKTSSAHYIIDKDGEIYYIIDESYRANHAGCKETGSRPVCRTWPPPANNDNSIGIEILNDGYSYDSFSDRQYNSIKALVGDIGQRYGFPITNNNVFAHYEITKDKWDPSPNFDWEKIGLQNHPTLSPTQVASLSKYGYGSTAVG